MYKYLIKVGALPSDVKIGHIFRRVQITVNGSILEGITLTRNDQNENQPVFIPGINLIPSHKKMITKLVSALTVRGNGALPLLCVRELKNISFPSPTDPAFAPVEPPQIVDYNHHAPANSNFKSSNFSGPRRQSVHSKPHFRNQDGSGGGGGARQHSSNHGGRTFAAQQPRHHDRNDGGYDNRPYDGRDSIRYPREYSPPPRDADASRAAMDMTVSRRSAPQQQQQESRSFFGSRNSQHAADEGPDDRYCSDERRPQNSRGMHDSRGGAYGHNDARFSGDREHDGGGGYSRSSHSQHRF
jgi:hypothetical protein